jgi:diguanylate cyclase (GGDEF)-like protein
VSTVAAAPARVIATVAAPPLLAAALIVLVDLPVVVDLAVMAVGVVIAVVLTRALVVRPLLDAVVRTNLDRAELEVVLHEERADRDFRDRLERALQLTPAEPATLRTGLRALAEVLPEADVSLLLNVPGEPRVGWEVRLVDGSLEPAVPLADTPGCAALASSTTVVTASSNALDACAHLHDPAVELSGVCIPLRLGDSTLGTVCITNAPGEVPDRRVLELAEWAVERTGVRVSEQRLQRGPSRAGRPDPVTSLPGPAALRHQLRDLVRTLAPFCVAVISVDGYEQLRYEYGDAESDDALRVTADVLCTTLRPDDLVCRLDGPRFAVVLAECTAGQATAALERVRESLALLLAAEGDPPFTCSAGIVESHRATSLEQILELAGEACASAHDAGGNRVSLAREA